MIRYLDPRTILRSTLYDCHFTYPERIIAALNIPPVSEEGAEFERADSHRRIHALDSIGPLVMEQCSWIALGCVNERYDYEASPDNPEHMAAASSFMALTFTATTAVLSTLVDKGIIVIAVDGIFRGEPL